MNTNERKQGLEAILQTVAGVAVELTIRAEKAFTISFDGRNDEAVKKIFAYFAGNVKTIESDYDAECDMSCVWFTA